MSDSRTTQNSFDPGAGECSPQCTTCTNQSPVAIASLGASNCRTVAFMESFASAIAFIVETLLAVALSPRFLVRPQREEDDPVGRRSTDLTPTACGGGRCFLGGRTFEWNQGLPEKPRAGRSIQT